MTTLAKTRYRLGFVAFQEQGDWQEQISNKKLKIPSGVDLQIEIAAFETGTTAYDLTNVASITLEIKSLDGNNPPLPGDATLMSSTVAVLDNATFTSEQWTARTHQHATFEFTDVESAIATGDKWLVISAVLTDGSLVSLGWGKIEIVQDGTGPTAAPAPTGPAYYTQAQVDALLAAYRPTAGSPTWDGSITGLAGGTATDLDAVATLTLSTTNTLYEVVIGGELQKWRLVTDTAATNVAAGVLRPLDHDATTNKKVWIRVL